MAKYKFTVLSMMKDEGHSVLEWVAFHHLAGFDNLVVYTNDCSDGTDDILIRLQELGLCQHFRNDVPEGKKPQPSCLRLAEKNPEVTDSEWILPMDVDEFVNIKCGNGRVQDLVDAIPNDTDAIAITWRFFGSGEIEEWNPGLVIESYTKSAPDHFPQGWGVKTMFRPFDKMKLGIHRPRMAGSKNNTLLLRKMGAMKWVNGSGALMPRYFSLSSWSSNKLTLGYDLVEMSHYAVKSYESYLLRAIRGNVNYKIDKYGPAYFSRYDRNELENQSMRRFVQKVQDFVDELLKDKTLGGLYAQAMNFHQNTIDRLRSEDGFGDGLAALKTAGQVSIRDAASVHFYHHFPLELRAQIKAMIDQKRPEEEITDFIKSQNTREKLIARIKTKWAKDIGTSRF